MHETISAVTFFQEMFDNVSRLYRCGVLSTPEEMTKEEYLTAYRSALYASIIKAPPATRLNEKEVYEASSTNFKKCLFVFFGEIGGKWFPMISKLSPQSASIEHLFSRTDIYIDSQGWIYNMKHAGIALAIYKL